jgi:outer membrane protein assembly factor BamB
MHTHLNLASLALPLTLVGCIEVNLTNLDDGVPSGVCPLDIPPSPAVVVDEECGAIPDVPDPWAMTEEWNYFGAGEDPVENSSYTPPLVARLTDSNEDGVIDELDHPNIVLVTFPWNLAGTREGSILVLDGVTREEVWQTSGIYYATGHAVGDVTGDGIPNIVAFDAGRRVLLLDAKGEMVWRTSVSSEGMYPQATIADLDADGVPEVIADNFILAGPTGDVIGELTVRSNIPYTMPAVGDIDLDGKQEILYSNALHTWDGEVIWTTNVSGDYGHFSAILNVDDDMEGEIAMVGGSRLVFLDTDGTELHRHDLPRRGGSAPCIGDFDGDGESEIAFGMTSGNLSSDPSIFRVYEIDGTVLWEREVVDQSGIAGCSGYDIDGDGALEILYADEVEVFVFDGATGEPRWRSDDHFSGTVYEYPVVADVDLDGAAEMLVVRSNDPSFPLLTVIGHDGPGWAPSGTTWPLHDFAVTNVTPEGTIPQAPPLYWVEHNTYRARPGIDESPVDLKVEVTDVCVAGCVDVAAVRVGVRVRSAGPMLVPPGVPVTLWAMGEDENIALETQTLESLQPGRVIDLVFETTLDQVRDTELLARVDDIGTGAGIWAECREENNEHNWGTVTCN